MVNGDEKNEDYDDYRWRCFFGIYLSIRLKELYSKDLDVIVLEANFTPLKKLLATGNWTL